jgi:tol-pal system protein YbgF
LNQLERSQKDLAATVDQLQRKVAEQVELVRAGRAASEERMREIEKQLQVVAQRVDESGQLVDDIKDSMRYSTSRPAAADSAGPAPTAAPVTPRSLYDAAYQDLTRGNHGLAILGFQEVLAKFPASELADNSQYWIGESYYAQKDFKQALVEFNKTVDNYPQGDKVPAAMLKIGLCRQQLNDKPAARAALQKLIDKYPASEEARLAKSKLQDL